jgi:ER membrane protein complex subunit 1
VKSSPAFLESTSLVLASGLDLFFTRVAPSGEFDVLSEGFSKSQLLATIAALAIALAVLQPLVQAKMLRKQWGEA